MGKLKVALAVLAAVVLVCPAFAQGERRKGGGQGRPGMGGGMGMGPGQLVAQKSVQEELKLDEEQVKKVTDMMQKMREEMRNAFQPGGDREAMGKAMREMAEKTDAMLKEVLKPDQHKRLKQISWQLMAKNQGLTAVLSNPEVAKELNITDDQKETLQAIQQDMREAMREMFQGGGGDREAMQKKMEEFRKSNDNKITKMLSDEQKSKWKEMIGAEFKGEITAPRRPGGGN